MQRCGVLQDKLSSTAQYEPGRGLIKGLFQNRLPHVDLHIRFAFRSMLSLFKTSVYSHLPLLLLLLLLCPATHYG